MNAPVSKRRGTATPDRTPRPPGRPASATPDDVLDTVMAAFLAGERVEINAVAAQLGVSRASIYRWFGSRDGVLGAALAREITRIFTAADRRCGERGAQRVSQVLDTAVRWLVDHGSLRRYFDTESTAALQLITRSDGPVHTATVGAVCTLIRRAEDEDGYRPPIERDTLAYALVRLCEAFLYNDAVAELRGDVDRLRAVQAALLRASGAD
jgi:AcrR family transcriptional regulator